jgi:hypothetical protein
MDGIWRRELKGNQLIVRIEPFIEVPTWVKHEAEVEAEKLARFLRGQAGVKLAIYSLTHES